MASNWLVYFEELAETINKARLKLDTQELATAEYNRGVCCGLQKTEEVRDMNAEIARMKDSVEGQLMWE